MRPHQILMITRSLSAPLVLALSFSPLQAAAQDGSQDRLMRIFTITCGDHLLEPDQLPEFMTRTGATEFEDDESRAFLHGKDGRAWAIPVDLGNYVVSLTDQGMCSVFARTGDTSQIEIDFRDLVATAPPPFTSTEVTMAPADQSKRRLSYNWTLSEQGSTAMNFTLTYSTSPDSHLRALVTSVLISR